jgi:hypothetical protein
VANRPPTTLAQDWATPFNRIEELNLYLSQAPVHKRDQVEREIAALQDELLDLPAPSFRAVGEKLRILFGGKLDDPDQGGRERRLILDDIEHLAAETSQLIGAAV